MEKDSQRGSALVELIMVMTLLILFGVTIYTIIVSGAATQERIMSERDAQTDARVALSYINVRLRQNDSRDKVAVTELALTGQEAILIMERTIDYEYDTWIYCIDGKLMECLVDAGAEPTVEDSFYIVDIDALETSINPEDGGITNTVYYYYGNERKELSSTIYMRSR